MAPQTRAPWTSGNPNAKKAYWSTGTDSTRPTTAAATNSDSSVNTEVVIEQAIELQVPRLPIVHTGGRSKTAYQAYGEKIRSAFAPGQVDKCFALLTEHGLDHPDAVSCVVEAIRSARVGSCLVLQPYRDEDDHRYLSTIRPAVEEHMQAVLLKEAGGSQPIYTSFVDAVSHSSTIIADITELNENVMYEVGYAHGRGLQPLLFTRDPTVVERLPVYLRTLNVHSVTDDELPNLIRNHLRDVKRRQDLPDLTRTTR